MEQLEEALEANVDIVMFDNMSNEDMQKAVARCRGKVITEASGGISIERIEQLRDIEIDTISSGALTHSAPAADISLDLTLG